MDDESDRPSTRRSIVTSLPSDYSDVQTRSYDPDFISAISNKMQVPDSIPALNGDNDFNPRRSAGWADREENIRYHDMNVPERILLAGGGEHIGTKPEIRALNFDDHLPASSYSREDIGLQTPPRTLTLEERFPSMDEEEEGNKDTPKHQSNGKIHNREMVAREEFSPSSINSGSFMMMDEEPEQIRHSLVALSRRIAVLEKQQKAQSSKETLMYTAAFGYLVLKFAFWFFRNP